MALLRGKTAVGLDIGDRYLRVAQLRSGSREPEWLQYREEELLPGWVEGGVIWDFAALLRKLQSVVREMKLQRQRTVAAIPAASVYSRTLKLPPMPLHELRAAARLQALTFLPLPPEETVSDIVPGAKREENGRVTQEVFFAAIRRAPAEALEQLCARSRLRLAAAESEADALHRLIVRAHHPDPIVLLYTEPGRLLLAAYANRRPLFLRSLNAGEGATRPALSLRPELSRAFNDLERLHQLRPDNIILCGSAEHNGRYADMAADISRSTVTTLDAAGMLRAGDAPAPEAAERWLLPLGLACRLLV
ncbi:MAG: hypothetical protein Q4B48_01595 [Syntrophomonadaceae bacterium]|nr:hypothetical protein [Syntrophomonadaceae bacterium]